MKKGYSKLFFYLGSVCLIAFEFLNVFLIVPIPGSQEINSLDIAYALYSFRWLFRIVFVGLIILGIKNAFKGWGKLFGGIILVLTPVIVYLANFEMIADKLFLPAGKITTKPRSENKVPTERLIIGIENNGQAKAYPIEFIAYHHQVLDSVGGKPFMITYCDVCHTGRVYEPIVNGKYEIFRLVGMDHYNAMFEDATTQSWWRQSTGEAVTGKLKGRSLKEFESKQMTIDNWFKLYPNGEVMQPVENFRMKYDSSGIYELGKHTDILTRTDSLSWKNKSWVVGLHLGSHYKVYDWNELKKEKIINDTMFGTPIVLALLSDKQTFIAFERPSILTSVIDQTMSDAFFTIRNDTLFSANASYDILGRNTENPSEKLKSVKAYQEYWHSWSYFHPDPIHKK